jgi:hypothetical protein
MIIKGERRAFKYRDRDSREVKATATTTEV